MTIKKAQSTVKSIRKDGLIDGKDADKAIAAVELTKAKKKDVVSNGEGKIVGALLEDSIFVGGPPPNRPGIMWNPPPLGSPARPHITGEAREKLNAFSIRHRLPYGDNREMIKSRIEAKMMEEMIPVALARKPNVKNLHEVQLPPPAHSADIPGNTAYYDSVKEHFYLRTDGHRGNGGKESWYGPYPLDAAPLAVG